MWKKIKKILTAVCTVIAGVFTALFIRSKIDGQGSTGTDELDKRVSDGIADCKNRADGIEDTIDRASDCLDRADGILQNAIKRSEEK